MVVTLKLLAGASMVWAVVALIWQVLAARGGGRREYSLPAGAPLLGIAFNFTYAMLPTHKESARLHPFKFAVGMLLHAGILAALSVVVLAVAWPTAARAAAPWLVPLLALALPAGLYLLVRRALDPTLRAMTSFDDFLAITAVIALLVLTGLFGGGLLRPTVVIAFAIPFFAYLPLGKLRHAMFFFVARADYGRRLGHRGVFPGAAPPRLEKSHAGP